MSKAQHREHEADAVQEAVDRCHQEVRRHVWALLSGAMTPPIRKSEGYEALRCVFAGDDRFHGPMVGEDSPLACRHVAGNCRLLDGTRSFMRREANDGLSGSGAGPERLAGRARIDRRAY